MFRSNRNSEWYVNLVGDNGEIVASSEGHKRKIDAVHTAEEVARGTDQIVIEGDNDG